MTDTQTWTPPPDIDPESIALCAALNALPGIRTTESCCGHESEPFRLWFKAHNLEALPPALYWLDRCHSGYDGWTVRATTDCAMSPVTFRVDGPPGPAGYEQAQHIANLIEGSLP